MDEDGGSIYFLPTHAMMQTLIILSCRILKKGRRSSTEDLEPVFNDEEEKENGYSSESEGEGRPDSVDDKVRKKEMRKGIDLATTLERIEKNFVITDPRLPDNPIVSKLINPCFLFLNLIVAVFVCRFLLLIVSWS